MNWNNRLNFKLSWINSPNHLLLTQTCPTSFALVKKSKCCTTMKVSKRNSQDLVKGRKATQKTVMLMRNNSPQESPQEVFTRKRAEPQCSNLNMKMALSAAVKVGQRGDYWVLLPWVAVQGTEPRESLRLEQELMSCHHSNITPSPQKRLQMPAGCCKPSLSSTSSSVIIPNINRCQELPWVVQEWEFPAGRENGT